MFRLFIDESYQHDHYYVAGVLLDEKQSDVLESRLEELAENLRIRNRWEASPEFHGHALMNGLDDWRDLHGKFGASVSMGNVRGDCRHGCRIRKTSTKRSRALRVLRLPVAEGKDFSRLTVVSNLSIPVEVEESNRPTCVSTFFGGTGKKRARLNRHEKPQEG